MGAFRRSFAAGTRAAHASNARTSHAESMTQLMRDLVLGTAFLFAFPVAISATGRASSEPGDPGAPPVLAEASPRS